MIRIRRSFFFIVKAGIKSNPLNPPDKGG